jgi:glutamine synthetase
LSESPIRSPCGTALIRLLNKPIRDAKSVSGVEFLVGFETEFILLKSTAPIVAVNDHGWSVSAALGTGSLEAKVLEEIAQALQLAGIELQMYHAEAAPGQVK